MIDVKKTEISLKECRERIKERRKYLKITLKELANKAGITEATMQRYESGKIKTIPYDTLTVIADALETSPAILMGWLEYDENAPIIDPDDLLAGVEMAERENKKILDDCYDKADSDGKRAIVTYAQQIISNGEIPTVPDVFIDYYNRVNDEGKAAILKYVKYIASDDEYKKCDTDDADSQGA